MEPLIVVAVTFVLCWLLFILPRQRQVRAHEALVQAVREGDEVVLSAGIYGRIVELGPERMRLEVAPGVEVWVARRAVLRRAEPPAVPGGTTAAADDDRAPAPSGPPATNEPRSDGTTSPEATQ
ncbi:MAG TPA: preprotein translocase subunit YajC [Acidimicrobiales bacterium]|nr:preprotein translocase subunit YajC [Acidimicrobiales bacterium]